MSVALGLKALMKTKGLSALMALLQKTSTTTPQYCKNVLFLLMTNACPHLIFDCDVLLMEIHNEPFG